MWWLLRQPAATISLQSSLPATPRVLVQFWDDASAVPEDVQACLENWAPLEDMGHVRVLFDDTSARAFIEEHLDVRHVNAFDRCTHPAMRADYFRLCFILEVGGVYVDADDVYQGGDLEQLLADGRLRLQALCYDIPSGSMLDAAHALLEDEVNDERIFYSNNNPLVAGPGHAVIAAALERATSALTKHDNASQDIQSLTGPGNITAALVRHAAGQEVRGSGHDFELLTTWDEVAVSKWPLVYRNDGRNWRRWVQGEAVPSGTKTARS